MTQQNNKEIIEKLENITRAHLKTGNINNICHCEFCLELRKLKGDKE